MDTDLSRNDAATAARRQRLRPPPPKAEQVVSDGNGDLASTRHGLSQRIRALREARRLSVTTLAGAAGVSPGMVSQIEHGQATPSVATLVGIANALGVKVGELFEDERSPNGNVVRRADRAAVDYPDLGVRDETLSADPTGRLQVLHSIIDPGLDSGAAPFVHGSDAECVLVLEGEITITLADTSVRLEQGDTVTFPGDVPHGFLNEGTETAHLVWIITPASY